MEGQRTSTQTHGEKHSDCYGDHDRRLLGNFESMVRYCGTVTSPITSGSDPHREALLREAIKGQACLKGFNGNIKGDRNGRKSQLDRVQTPSPAPSIDKPILRLLWRKRRDVRRSIRHHTWSCELTKFFKADYRHEEPRGLFVSGLLAVLAPFGFQSYNKELLLHWTDFF